MKKPSDSLALYDYIHEIGAAAIKIAQNHNTSSSVIVIFLYLQVSAQFLDRKLLIGIFLLSEFLSFFVKFTIQKLEKIEMIF